MLLHSNAVLQEAAHADLLGIRLTRRVPADQLWTALARGVSAEGDGGGGGEGPAWIGTGGLVLVWGLGTDGAVALEASKAALRAATVAMVATRAKAARLVVVEGRWKGMMMRLRVAVGSDDRMDTRSVSRCMSSVLHSSKKRRVD
jgi:hypothetical protein